jgi:hypothetical protein
MIEIRHFLMSIFRLILSGTSSLDGLDCCMRIFELQSRSVACYNMIKLILSLVRQNFEQFRRKCNPFGSLIAVENVRNSAQIELFNSKKSCSIHKHVAFASLK